MVWKLFYNDKKQQKGDEAEAAGIPEEIAEDKEIKEKTEKGEETTAPVKEIKPKEDKVYIIPLGGLGEVGKNMTLFQHKDEIIAIDAGLTFPGDEMPGIDLVIPDFNYIVKNVDKLKGVILSHGHEDHIGGLPYLFKSIPKDIPVYGSRLTIEMARSKCEGTNGDTDYNFLPVKGRDKIKIGKYFEIEFITVTHSIPDAFAIAIHTPAGIIFHTCDFKVDLSPIKGESMDFFKLAELGEKGVLMMLSDSTNAEREGYTLSEGKVGDALDQVFDKTNGRIVVVSFSSHIHRIQQIIDKADKYGRQIAIDGRSLLRVVEIASKWGYLNIPDGVLVQIKDVENIEDKQIVILCTGSQGEPMSALSRIANRSHKHINIKEGDTVIISANPIPGNEKAIFNIINKLLKHNAEVIYEKIAGVHVSGHGSQEELKLMLNLIKPKFFMPVHGEIKQLKAHKRLAIELGINDENIVIVNNGDKVEVTKSEAKINGKVPSGVVLIDGIGVGDVGNIVLRDRQHLAQDGIVVVVTTISKETGKLMAGPDIITRGFVYARESEEMIRVTSDKIRDELKKLEADNVKEWSILKTTVKDTASKYLYEMTKRNPIILPIIMEV